MEGSGYEGAEYLAMRAAKERHTCARLCVEDFLGSDSQFHPADYRWNNTEKLPANSASCNGKSAFIIYDTQKTVVVLDPLQITAQNEANQYTDWAP